MQTAKQIILWLALAIACFLPAAALTSSALENRIWEISSIGCDAATTEATDTESRTATSTSNYDTVPIYREITEKIPTEANRALFGPNAEFKAAEGVDELATAARVADRGGFTAAGRSLTKHGSGARQGNALFPAATGSPSSINQLAHDIVDDILTTPGTTFQQGFRGRFGNTLEVTAPDGRGIVYGPNGEFLFFKE